MHTKRRMRKRRHTRKEGYRYEEDGGGQVKEEVDVKVKEEEVRGGGERGR